MLYMVIENFKAGKEKEIYRRAENKGRMLPDGLEYINSWVSSDIRICYQLMRCNDAELLNEWIAKWIDLVDFEIIPVISSKNATDKALGKEEDV